MTSSRTPTEAMTLLFEATEPLLKSLRAMADAQAARRPAEPVPESTLSEARALLAAARRVLSREPIVPGLLTFRNNCDWAALATKLGLAVTAFAAFERSYKSWDKDLEVHIWLTREWAEASHAGAGLALPDNEFEEIDEDLSMSF